MTDSHTELQWLLYRQMYFCRQFEIAVADFWRQGVISGEMHLGTGEEGIIAGIAAHLRAGDALALDHRPTAAMLLHGVDPIQIMQEIVGHPAGLGRGQGGHMHLFSKEHLSASSGIVGASGPAGVGFALAGQILRPGSLTVAYFGDGSLNQGMLMESFNLAAEWQLPVVFVCKDDGWAITTTTHETRRVSPEERAKGFGLPVYSVDGSDVEAVYQTAGEAISKVRQGGGPVFIHATCSHSEGHMMDLQLVRIGRKPIREGIVLVWPSVKALFSPRGGRFSERLAALKRTLQMIFRSSQDHKDQPQEPVARLKEKLAQLDPHRLENLEAEVDDVIWVIDLETFHVETEEVRQ